MGCVSGIEETKKVNDCDDMEPQYGHREKPNLEVVIRVFEENVLTSPNIRGMLLISLSKAKQKAMQTMTKDLYDYFDWLYPGCGWPTTVKDYVKYVRMYMTKVPFAVRKMDMIRDRVEKLPENGSGENRLGNYQVYTWCVYNELCHFYWLVNQKVEKGHALQSTGVFASWIKIFAQAQGIFLNSRESLTPDCLASFEKNPKFHTEWYSDNRSKWVSFNTFFSRKFNGADPNTGISHSLRPIDPEKYVITAPADCTFKAVYPIDQEGVLRDMDNNPVTLKVNGFSKLSTVQELLTLEACPFWKNFCGGTFIHYFLSPTDYHRFHTPVDGLVTVVKKINGQNYLEVNLTSNGRFSSKDEATNGYEFQQQRGLIIVENETFGPVATLPIGMAQVDGVVLYKDKLLYKQVEKGQELGYFVFGGSDIIVLIPKPVEQLDIVKGTKAEPYNFKYGSRAVRWLMDEFTRLDKDFKNFAKTVE